MSLLVRKPEPFVKLGRLLLKKVTDYSGSFLEECPNLEKIECPELEMVEVSCFYKLESIKKLSLPKLKKLSSLSLSFNKYNPKIIPTKTTSRIKQIFHCFFIEIIII